MEKLEKEENLDEELDVFRAYGFNVDDLLSMFNDDED